MYSTGRRAREWLSQPITANALGVSGARHKDSIYNPYYFDFEMAFKTLAVELAF